VIIDFHTHIFPPDVRDRREEYLRRDPTFAEMYTNPKAKIATAEDLLRSMDESGVGLSVALGFAWRDHEDCVRHNDYLLEAAERSGGRIVPFCTANLAAGADASAEVERCARAGARGLGELRPESQGWDLNGEPGERLAALARQHNLVLLFHVTEPAGRDYPGKQGLSLDSFRRYLASAQGVAVVGAHLAGGLPLRDAALPSAYADTAALRFLYEPTALAALAKTPWAERLLFGSDFPLVSQAAALADIRASGLDGASLARILGDNARALLPTA
jgi:predicted TIM-barrel fold metal-dependent hydrolase